jgi:hypothetical protein
MPLRSNREGAYLVKGVMTLENGILVIRTTRTSQATGAVLEQNETRYSK